MFRVSRPTAAARTTSPLVPLLVPHGGTLRVCPAWEWVRARLSVRVRPSPDTAAMLAVSICRASNSVAEMQMV